MLNSEILKQLRAILDALDEKTKANSESETDPRLRRDLIAASQHLASGDAWFMQGGGLRPI